MADLVLGMFHERGNAEQLIDDLKDRGYNPKDFSIVMRDQTEAREFVQDTGAGEVVEGAATGATTGALLGGLVGLVASFALPGLGAFFIGGPIAAALGLGGAAASTVSGAVTGAAAGGLIGALTSSFGMSEEEARKYEGWINEGGILVAVPAREGEADDVRELMMEFNGDQIKIIDQVTDTGRSRATQKRYDSQYFAQMGSKGGKTSSKRRSQKRQGQGWHDDSKHHADAARGEDPHD
jgi:uncharacterized membrane protein